MLFISHVWLTGDLAEEENSCGIGNSDFSGLLYSLRIPCFCQNWRSTSPTYIKIRVVHPLMQREALARMKADFTLQRVKGNLFQGLIWLLIIWSPCRRRNTGIYFRDKNCCFTTSNTCCSCLDASLCADTLLFSLHTWNRQEYWQGNHKKAVS